MCLCGLPAVPGGRIPLVTVLMDSFSNGEGEAWKVILWVTSYVRVDDVAGFQVGQSEVVPKDKIGSTRHLPGLLRRKNPPASQDRQGRK